MSSYERFLGLQTPEAENHSSGRHIGAFGSLKEGPRPSALRRGLAQYPFIDSSTFRLVSLFFLTAQPPFSLNMHTKTIATLLLSASAFVAADAAAAQELEKKQYYSDSYYNSLMSELNSLYVMSEP